MKRTILTLTVILTAAALVVVFCGSAMAKVAGRCDNCHTMHASQTPWNTNWDGSVEGNPQKYLLGKGCVACHSGEIGSNAYYDLGPCKVPIVNHTGGAGPSDYLAGGNFWWVAQSGGDPKGHNVYEISAGDGSLSEAPGNVNACGGSCHLSLATDTAGCTGCHLNPRHHADDHANGVSGYVSNNNQGWYRFLSGHDPTVGVVGYEHGEWENGQPDLPQGDTNNHNQYLGEELDHTGSIIGLSAATDGTTTAYCCGCHGNFHDQDPTSRSGTLRDWTRHPSDAVIPTDAGSDYAPISVYDPLSPVAMPLADVGTLTGAVEPGTDMVMCLSCHRPHGSPNDDLLRWDYAAMSAGGGGDDTGCFYCHTTKN